MWSRSDAGRSDAAKPARDRRREAVEPLRGRERVKKRTALGTVLVVILQHVNERISHLPRAR